MTVFSYHLLYGFCLPYIFALFFSFNMSSFFQENHEIDVAMTNDDVLGDEIPRDQQDEMRRFCYQTLKLGVGVGFSSTSL